MTSFKFAFEKLQWLKIACDKFALFKFAYYKFEPSNMPFVSIDLGAWIYVRSLFVKEIFEVIIIEREFEDAFTISSSYYFSLFTFL